MVDPWDMSNVYYGINNPKTNLDKIFNNLEHKSDKWRPYLEVYERHFSSFTNRKIDLVEVGIQEGGSLELWSKYFLPGSRITGVDLAPKWDLLNYKSGNITVITGDQSSLSFWDMFLKDRNIDIFIDDGSHLKDHQITTFEKVFPKISLGGVYVCEDCHTSYLSGFGGSFVDYAKQYIDVLHSTWYKADQAKLAIADGLSAIYFYDSQIIFEKFGKSKMERVYPSRFG